MNKIKSTYYLVFVVALIWVFVVVRLISFKKDDSVMNQVKHTSRVNLSADSLVKEKLSLAYRDPFFKKKFVIKKSTTNNVKASLLKQKPQWPQVTYSGYVVDKMTGIKNINVKVGNRSFLARVNQIVDEVRIKKIAKDFIEVEYQGDSKLIYSK